MSQGCALSILDLVDLVEAGGRPLPVFFADLNCRANNHQWPRSEEYGSASTYINVNKVDLFARGACKQIPYTIPTQYPNNNNTLPVLSIEDCPLPGILSMIIPDNMVITFEMPLPPTDNTGKSLIYEQGYINISASTASNNVINISTAPNGGGALTWGSIRTSGGIDCHYPAGKFGPGYDVQDPTNNPNGTNQILASLQSCGAPFWPTLAPLQTVNSSDGTISPYQDAVAIDTDNTNWVSCPLSYNGGKGTTGICSASSAQGGSGVTFATQSIATLPSNRISGITGTEVWYSRCECVPTPQQIVFNQGCTPEESSYVCDSGYEQNRIGQCFRQNNADTVCAGVLAGGINVQYVSMFDTISWEEQQITACTGKPISLGGIPIQRYTNSTPTCDVLVESICSNTAALDSNPTYQKVCKCIVAQKRLNAQYAGIDLPIQCFTGDCPTDDPAVYKTSSMALGCSAQLCLQIVNINGSAIASEGHQTLTCDGKTYQVSNTDTSITPVPTITPGSGGIGGIHLGIIFYISLGILIFMIVLLVTWGIYKFVSNRRHQARQRQQISDALTAAI